MILSKLQKVMMWWDNSISVFTLTIVNVVLAFYNPSLFILLPLNIGFDMLLLALASLHVYKQAFAEMLNDYNLFGNIQVYTGQLKEIGMSEMKRFKMFNEGNLYGTKDIEIFVSEKLHRGAVAYSFWADESIILLHNEFDESNDIDIFKLLHEMFHCVYHCLIRQHRIMVRIQVTCMIVLIIISSSLSFNMWIAITGLTLCLALLFVETKTYDESRREVEANVMALTIFEHRYGSKRNKRVAKIICDIALEQLEAKSLKSAIPIVNEICKLSRFLTKEDLNSLVMKIEEMMFIWRTIVRQKSNPECKKENKRTRRNLLTLWLLMKKRINKPQLKNFRNGYMTWSPSLYYILFPVLMFVSFLAVKNILIGITIPSWSLSLALIPVVLFLVIWRTIKILKLKKGEFIKDLQFNIKKKYEKGNNKLEYYRENCQVRLPR